DAVDVAEQLVVARGDVAPEREDLVELLDLPDAEGRADVAQPVVVTEPHVLEPAARVAASLIPQRAQQSPLVLGVRRDDSALPRRDLLVRIEGEHAARPVRAEGRTAILGTERLARVLDEREPVLRRDRAQLVELARIAVDVDGDDRLRPRSDRGLD